jgi:hypothetical protein
MSVLFFIYVKSKEQPLFVTLADIPSTYKKLYVLSIDAFISKMSLGNLSQLVS